MKVLIDYDYAMPLPLIDETAKRFEKMIKTCKAVCQGIRLDDEERFLAVLKGESKMRIILNKEFPGVMNMDKEDA